MCYFISLSYRSFMGSMGHWDYSLLSNHMANPVESKMCSYTIYRTKDRKDNLSLLYSTRSDFIKTVILEKALTSLFMTLLLIAPCLAAIITQSSYKELIIMSPMIGMCIFFTLYYFYGYATFRSN